MIGSQIQQAPTAFPGSRSRPASFRRGAVVAYNMTGSLRSVMTDPAAFYSYVRKDDEHERGNLTKIRKCLAVEVEMQTGQEFIIFQDRDDILWGQRWQARI